MSKPNPIIQVPYDAPMHDYGNGLRFFFSHDGTWEGRKRNILSRKETVTLLASMGELPLLNITLDTCDAKAKIMRINYERGYVDFDRTLDGYPVATFCYTSRPREIDRVMETGDCPIDPREFII